MKKSRYYLKYLPELTIIIIAGIGLITYSGEASNGIREGLTLLGSTVIPSLFPFLVLSAYLTESSTAVVFGKILKKPTEVIFKTSGISSISLLMGAVGGYPLGAKTTASLFSHGQITSNEAERLLLWCTCPGPAFTVTALGAVVLKSTKSGIIIYSSALLSAITIGFFCRFLSSPEKPRQMPLERAHASLSSAVSSALSSVLGISAWVLTFSCISGIINAFSFDDGVKTFLKITLEVTTGCTTYAGSLPLPVTAAAVGFGGIAVMCQILPYLKECGVLLRRFAAARVLNAALCAFYCSGLIKLFPSTLNTSVTYETRLASISLSYTTPVFAVLIIMCALFVFQVDNRKKV